VNDKTVPKYKKILQKYFKYFCTFPQLKKKSPYKSNHLEIAFLFLRKHLNYPHKVRKCFISQKRVFIGSSTLLRLSIFQLLCPKNAQK